MSKLNETNIRPKKDDINSSNLNNEKNIVTKSNTEKKPVGRPKKENSNIEANAKKILAETLVQKRPVGRPKKEDSKAETIQMNTSKRPVGRPRKEDSSIYAYIGPISISNKNITELLSNIMKVNATNDKINLVLSKSLDF